jgi:hypothetical protein
MRHLALVWIGGLTMAGLVAAQQAPSVPDAESPVANKPDHAYTAPTHAEKFQTYIRHTYGLGSFFEAAVRAGIDQARDRPTQWPEGAEGYAERFGSAMGTIIVHGTTSYALSELFKEDLRHVPCRANCSKLKAAFEDTFTARKGEDGHRNISIARLVGPISGALVASTWRPDGLNSRHETIGGIGITYGLVFMRNLVREMIR